MLILTPRSRALVIAHFRSGNLYEPSSPAITSISFWAVSMSSFTCFLKISSVGLGFIFLSTMVHASEGMIWFGIFIKYIRLYPLHECLLGCWISLAKAG